MKPSFSPSKRFRSMKIARKDSDGSMGETDRKTGTPSVTAREKKSSRGIATTSCSFGQTIALAALCSSLAAVLTAWTAVYFFSTGGIHRLTYTDRSIDSDRETVRSRLRPNQHAQQMATLDDRARANTKRDGSTRSGTKEPSTNLVSRSDSTNEAKDPHLAWLMSFPNSGTSFTLHMTRESTNCTTATNYALEGEIKDEPSVPAISGALGENGPWLELIPERPSEIPKTILTKTHCKGFCNGRSCGPDKTIQTVRSFMVGCLSGTRAVATSKGLKKMDVTYRPSLVKKAIHIFRHPLDNIVARFHLEYNVQKAKGNKKYVEVFPKNVTGFRRWCAADDQNKGLLASRLIDDGLRHKLYKIPCFNEFYRYTQWHNLAFSVTHDMDLPTMILHYHEYSTDFKLAREKVLNWLGFPSEKPKNEISFVSGKVYRHYYSLEQRKLIRSFIKEMASAETWEQLKTYDYEIDENLDTA